MILLKWQSYCLQRLSLHYCFIDKRIKFIFSLLYHNIKVMNKIFFLSLLILILVACTNKQSNGKNAELEANTESVVEEGTQKTEFAVKEESYI